jgi:hypothetical protein
MMEGYYNESDIKYYCSDECLHEELTQEQIDELQEDEDNLELYWTEWELEDIETNELLEYIVEELENPTKGKESLVTIIKDILERRQSYPSGESIV